MVEVGTYRSLWTGPTEDPHRYRVDLSEEGLVSVGDGGEGLVYQAVRMVDGVSMDVALKMLTNLTLDDYERLAARSKVIAAIDDPHVMRQIETFVGTALLHRDRAADAEFDVLYSVAEWIPGDPIGTALEVAGTAVGLAWVAQIARGLNSLHSYYGPGAPDGIVHRDVKPSNVRITSDGDAKLIDFGIARPQAGTELTDGIGTYLWRAPEVVGGPGKPGIPSDNWGVGALAYWVLTGDAPRLEGAAAARERMVHSAAANQFPNPYRLATHIAALLETHPDARPTDLIRWADRADVLTGRSFRAPGDRRLTDRLRLPSGELWHRKRRTIRIGAVVVSLLLVVSLVAVWTTRLNQRVSTQSDDLLSGEVASEASAQLLSTSSSNLVTGMQLSIAAAEIAPTEAARVDLIKSLESPTERVIQGGGALNSDAISPDGKTLVAGGSDGSVQFWSMRTGRRLRSPARIAKNASVTALSFSTNSQVVAIGTTAPTNNKGQVVLWNVSEHKPVSRPLTVEGRVISVAFSPDSRSVVVGTGGPTGLDPVRRTGCLC